MNGAVQPPLPRAAVSREPGGEAVESMPVTFELAPVADLPRPLYRQVLHLRFSPTEGAEEIVIEEAGCRLRGRFRPLIVDATERAKAASGALEVELDAPRRLHQVAFGSAVDLGSKPVGVHRVDGAAVAEEATTVLVTRARVPSRTRVAAATADNLAFDLIQGPLVVSLAPKVLRPRETFVGQSFAFKRHRGNLAASALERLELLSLPAAPRIGVAELGAPEDREPFWSTGGEIGGDQPVAAGRVDTRGELATALARRLAGRSPAAEAVEVALVVESDAPCRFELEELVVPYRYRRRSWPSGEAKEVLRFAGDEVLARQLALELPAGIHVLSAGLRLAESLTPGSTAPEAAAVPAVATGARLVPGRWRGQILELPRGLTVRAAVLQLLALEAGTEVLVELQADAGGVPSGRCLAASTTVPAVPGRASWQIVELGAVTLRPGRYWLLAQPSRGRALWLAEAAVDGRLVELERADARSAWRVLGSLAAAARHRLLAAGPAVASGTPFTLTVGDQEVAAASRADDFTVFELADDLNRVLAEDGGNDLVTVPLTFTAPRRGQLTVYPPLLEFV